MPTMVVFLVEWIGSGQEIVGERIEGRNRKGGHRKSSMMDAAASGGGEEYYDVRL